MQLLEVWLVISLLDGGMSFLEVWLVIAILGTGSYFFCLNFGLLGCLLLGAGFYFFHSFVVRGEASHTIPQWWYT